MILRFIKVTAFLISFIFLTGFIPFISLLGPSFTVATTGSVYKAGFQFMVNKSIKDTTGKNSLDFVKEKIYDGYEFEVEYLHEGGELQNCSIRYGDVFNIIEDSINVKSI